MLGYEVVREGSKKNVNLWSLTIMGGGWGGSARTIPLLQNSIVFLKHYIHIQLYSICSLYLNKSHIYPFKTLLS